MARRRSPLSGAFFTPPNLTPLSLIHSLASISRDLLTAHSSPVTPLRFQRRNSRSLLRHVSVLLALFESLKDSAFISLPPSAHLCFRELYIVVFRARSLLDYCAQSSRLWLLIQNLQLSGHFHDLTMEIATILDVLPIADLCIGAELQEQLRLMRKQLRRSKMYLDPRDEVLRLQIYSFLDELDKGTVPDQYELENVFVNGLGIRKAEICRLEIEFLEELIFGGEEDGTGTDATVLGGFVALTRYCRFLLFGFGDERRKLERNAKNRLSFKGNDDCYTVPKDFCCPISLDLMRDPVTVSTGQTYDRASIVQWIDDGHKTCPNSGQVLSHKRLVPNVALRRLISQWCSSQQIEYDAADCCDASAERISSSRAAVEANKSTARILVQALSNRSDAEKAVAARELRLLAKTGKENRAFIAEAGAIPLLHKLFSSADAVAQENAVTAILNLSIHEMNKSIIIGVEGCLASIVDVLRHGKTAEARENAAATLFSLSAVHVHKKIITDEPGAVEALAGLLRHGSQRGKRDAVTALFNLSTHPDCCMKLMESGAVWALLETASSTEGVAEEAAGALALLLRKQIVAEVVGRDDVAVGKLMGLMKRGTPKSKENAVAAMYELCRSGGAVLTRRLAKTTNLGNLIQSLLLTGTKRARRKAASLAKLCQRCEPEVPFAGGAAWGMDYTLTRSSSFIAGDISVSVAVSV